VSCEVGKCCVGLIPANYAAYMVGVNGIAIYGWFFQRAHLSRMKIDGFFLPSLCAQGISFSLTTPSQIEKKKTCSCLTQQL
jgi:hypothetical protein